MLREMAVASSASWSPRCCPLLHTSRQRLSLWQSAHHSRGIATSVSATASTVDHPLQQWVTSHGGSAAGVRLDTGGPDDSTGWGLVAAQDAPAGSHLITLPLACHLTFGAGDDPRLLTLIDRVPTELWGAKLALQMLAHRTRQRASPFAPYISHLPPAVSGLPMFFPREAVTALEYPPTLQQVNMRCRWLASFAKEELSPLPGTDRDPFSGVAIDANGLGWALAVVTSRAFRTRGPSQPASLLPLVDMANHSFDPNCEVLPTGGHGDMALITKRPVLAGEPLLLCYGQLSNDFLLLDYGFVCTPNPNDRVALNFQPALLQAGALMAGVENYHGEDSDLLSSPWKAKMLQRLKLVGPSADTEVNLGGPQHVDARLLAAARTLAAAGPAELLGRDAASLGDLEQRLASAASETAALRTLVSIAEFALSRFSTSLEADAAALLARPQPSVPPAAAVSEPATRSRAGAGGAAGDSGPSSSSGAGAAVPAASVPLSEELQLALRYRMEKKRLLSAALQELGKRVVAVGLAGDLKPAAGKGFGDAAKSSGGGGGKVAGMRGKA